MAAVRGGEPGAAQALKGLEVLSGGEGEERGVGYLRPQQTDMMHFYFFFDKGRFMEKDEEEDKEEETTRGPRTCRKPGRTRRKRRNRGQEDKRTRRRARTSQV